MGRIPGAGTAARPPGRHQFRDAPHRTRRTRAHAMAGQGDRSPTRHHRPPRPFPVHALLRPAIWPRHPIFADACRRRQSHEHRARPPNTQPLCPSAPASSRPRPCPSESTARLLPRPGMALDDVPLRTPPRIGHPPHRSMTEHRRARMGRAPISRSPTRRALRRGRSRRLSPPPTRRPGSSAPGAARAPISIRPPSDFPRLFPTSHIHRPAAPETRVVLLPKAPRDRVIRPTSAYA